MSSFKQIFPGAMRYIEFDDSRVVENDDSGILPTVMAVDYSSCYSMQQL